jgi:hypothetical protein
VRVTTFDGYLQSCLRRGEAINRHLRQTKIENFGMTAFGEKNVCRLDVAV